MDNQALVDSIKTCLPQLREKAEKDIFMKAILKQQLLMLEMLRPIEPGVMETSEYGTYKHCFCPNPDCGMLCVWHSNERPVMHCKWCGQAIKWKDDDGD